MKKVIVTGGAGFIGSHLTERLVREGHKVTVLDNLVTGRLKNLEAVGKNKNLSFVKLDITNAGRLNKYFKGADWVFHLAALADIVPSVVTPLKYHHVNVDGTAAVLEASRKNRVKKFIYTASSSCYGIPEEYPTNELARISTEYPYAFTKYVGECFTFHWAKVYKLPVVSLRLFNVYGPRARSSGTYGAVIGVFLAQKLTRKPLTIVGDGRQKRDFVFVTDVVDAFIKAAASGVKNEIFNVGSGAPQSINRLAALLGKNKVYIPRRPGEPECTWADISKIKRCLFWKPSVLLEEGVRRVLENITYWKDAPVWTPEKIKKATKEWFKCISDDGKN